MNVLDLETEKVWSIIEGCESVNDTKYASEVVSMYEAKSTDTVRKQVVQSMRDELFDISVEFFKNMSYN